MHRNRITLDPDTQEAFYRVQRAERDQAHAYRDGLKILLGIIALQFGAIVAMAWRLWG